jgi:hypothetical protein
MSANTRDLINGYFLPKLCIIFPTFPKISLKINTGVAEFGRPACRQAGASQTMFYTYAISSIEKKYIYVGLSNNPQRRISEHNSGKEKTTRYYAPFKTVVGISQNDRWLPEWRNW